MKKEFKGIDGTVGAMASWDSENKEVRKGGTGHYGGEGRRAN